MLAACGARDEDAPILNVFDPCTLSVSVVGEASLVERGAVAEGVSLWNEAAATRIQVADASAEAIPVKFMEAAGPFYGLYDDARVEILINRTLPVEDGRPITVAHEVGHAMGLHHVSRDERPSVMNPANLELGPTEADAAAVLALWGTCPAP